jgi:tetratricopeptide (TPR) repeat protein
LKETERIERRLRLVEDHWSLGEDEEALRCLERAIDEDPNDPGIAEQVRLLRASAESDHHPVEIRERLDEVAARVFGSEEEGEPEPVPVETPEEPDEDFPVEMAEEEEEGLPAVATSTVAELLADQGLHEKARQVANEVLERSPSDERARTLLRKLSGDEAREGNPIQALERWLTQVRRVRREREAHP